MAIDLTIRHCREGDAPLIADLGRQTFLEAYADIMDTNELESYVSIAFTHEQIVNELADENSSFIIAESGGQPVGYAKIREGPAPECVTGGLPIELERIYAVRSHVGVGVGAGLMTACLGRAKERSRDVVWLGVWEHNDRAIGFYERFGFKPVGEKTFLVGSDLQRDIVFELHITPG